MMKTNELGIPEGRPGGCERVRGRLERLLDRDLTPLEMARDHGHLEVCVACRRERERWREFLTLLGRAAHLEGAAEVEFEEARRALERQVARRPWTPRPHRLAQAWGRGNATDAWKIALVTIAAGILGILGLHATGLGAEDWPRLPQVSALRLPLQELPAWTHLLPQGFATGGPQ